MEPHVFKVGKIWHYRFQINGARVQRSTGESIKRNAEQVAARALRHARMWARGDEPVPTLRQLVVDWIETHRRIKSPSYIRLIETFGRLHLYDLADVMVDELTTDRVEAAMLLHRADRSPATVNHWLTMLKVLCKWAVRRKIMPALPWSVPILKIQKRPRSTLPVSSVDKWLRSIDEYGARRPAISIAMRLMFGLGLRESEVISARWEWIDWDRKTYTPGVTKGREADPLPIPRWLVSYLTPYRQAEGLIVRGIRGNHLSPGFARRAMEAANKACNIQRLTPHRLRGTYATLLSEHGAPVQTVQRMMRHKDPKTTMGYLEVNLASAARAQSRIARASGVARTPKPSGEEVANNIPESAAAQGCTD